MVKKEKQPRNWLAVHAHNKTNAGPMGQTKGRKNTKSRDILQKELEEAVEETLDVLKQTEEDENT